MLSPCLIDTNILIYALTSNATPAVLARIDSAIADQARYSVVTRMELLGWRGHTPDIVAKVIDIRSVLSIKLPDAIIAASALTERLSLLTRNTADFSRVPELQSVDPFDT